MKKRNILLGILCFLMLFVLTGCGKKTVKTSDEFVSIAKSHNLNTMDATGNYATLEYIKEIKIAQSEDGWQMEFYVFDSEENAKAMYTNNRAVLESNKGSNYADKYAELSNYSTYELTTDNTYTYIGRVENTVVYVDASKNNKDTIKAIIKELGY